MTDIFIQAFMGIRFKMILDPSIVRRKIILESKV